jgi:hypothetical protein
MALSRLSNEDREVVHNHCPLNMRIFTGAISQAMETGVKFLRGTYDVKMFALFKT